MKNLEKLYAAGLLRLPGEPAEAPLDRLASVTVRPALSDIHDSRIKKIVKLAYGLATSSRSTTLRYAAQAAEIDEQELQTWANELDPDAFALYA